MPKGKKKKFIDRKNAVTFHLVHRSQQDPLIADENAPQHVLVNTTVNKTKDTSKAESIRKEKEKYGIYFDDDYNYLQHLREVSGVEWVPVERPNASKTSDTPKPLGAETKRLNLPSSVFASRVEEDVGLLNKAAPQSGIRLDLDPDVVAALDDDFDFSDPDNLLEDDFIALANVSGSESDDYSNSSGLEDDDEEGYSGSESEQEDDVASLNGPQYSFADEETKSRFTNYSMSSSVMRRNENLSILDSRFEHMFADYDDSEIGALDCEEIEGHLTLDSEAVLQCVEEFNRLRATERHETDTTLRNKCLEMMPEEDEDPLEELEVPDKVDEKWDCQSIISTYSNIYNHPKIISESRSPGRIQINRKTGIPMDVLDGNGSKLTARALARLDESNNSTARDENDDDETVISTLSVLSIRPKNETSDDRRLRKKALKDYRKERREERKANILAFKEEKKRQEKVILNCAKNQQTVHIM